MQQYSNKRVGQEDVNCLMIEDNHFDQRMMNRVLSGMHMNFQVEVVSTLEEGWSALQKSRFSLILLDNNLPDGYGVNFALQVAADKRLSEIPIIFVSDWPSPFMRDKLALAGVKFVIDKSEFEGRYVVAALKSKAVN